MKLIGIDIGGSHISAAQVICSTGKVEFGQVYEQDVDTFGRKDEIISAWAKVIQKTFIPGEKVKIGIAMPGPYDYVQGISLIKDQGKMNSLFGLSVKNLLAEKLKVAAEYIDFTNDAESFLRGESLAGGGVGFSNSMGITLGTGLGSAIKIHDVVKDGKLWTAPFRDGIAEDYLGTNWFVKAAYDRFGVQISGVKDLIQYDFDPSVADRLFEDFGKALGEFLFPYVTRMHIEGVVLGGKISDSIERFLPYTQSCLEQLGWKMKFKKAILGEKAALLGACSSFIIDQKPC